MGRATANRSVGSCYISQHQHDATIFLERQRDIVVPFTGDIETVTINYENSELAKLVDPEYYVDDHKLECEKEVINNQVILHIHQLHGKCMCGHPIPRCSSKCINTIIAGHATKIEVAGKFYHPPECGRAFDDFILPATSTREIHLFQDSEEYIFRPDSPISYLWINSCGAKVTVYDGDVKLDESIAPQVLLDFKNPLTARPFPKWQTRIASIFIEHNQLFDENIVHPSTHFYRIVIERPIVIERTMIEDVSAVLGYINILRHPVGIPIYNFFE